jgi:ketosteroid isomerase-like protein
MKTKLTHPWKRPRLAIRSLHVALAVFAGLLILESSAFAGDREDAIAALKRWGTRVSGMYDDRDKHASDVDELYDATAALHPTVDEGLWTKNGPNIIKKYFKDKFLPKRPTLMGELTPNVTVLPNGTYMFDGEYTFEVDDGDKRGRVRARYIFIFKKFGDKWLIIYHYSKPLLPELLPPPRELPPEGGEDGGENGSDEPPTNEQPEEPEPLPPSEPEPLPPGDDDAASSEPTPEPLPAPGDSGEGSEPGTESGEIVVVEEDVLAGVVRTVVANFFAADETQVASYYSSMATLRAFDGQQYAGIEQIAQSFATLEAVGGVALQEEPVVELLDGPMDIAVDGNTVVVQGAYVYHLVSGPQPVSFTLVMQKPEGADWGEWDVELNAPVAKILLHDELGGSTPTE